MAKTVRAPNLRDHARSIFLASLASALRAGQEPRVALDLLGEDDLDGRLARVARVLAGHSADKPLSAAMALMPGTFSPATVEIVLEGERSRKLADTLDLVADLDDYRPPAGASERATQAGVTITQATRSESGAVLAFESSTFPSWARWFEPSDQNILVARDREGGIAGTLLFEGPGADTVFLPLLGPAAGTIGCVGVAPHRQGQGIGTAMVARASEILRDAGTRTCHIGWTVRESFYARAGYRPWRRYRMFRRTTGHPATTP